MNSAILHIKKKVRLAIQDNITMTHDEALRVHYKNDEDQVVYFNNDLIDAVRRKSSNMILGFYSRNGSKIRFRLGIATFEYTLLPGQFVWALDNKCALPVLTLSEKENISIDNDGDFLVVNMIQKYNIVKSHLGHYFYYKIDDQRILTIEGNVYIKDVQYIKNRKRCFCPAPGDMIELPTIEPV